MTRWDETWHRLRDWTGGQGPSEWLAAQVLIHEGFTGVDPSRPLGGRDGGKDALAWKHGRRWALAVHFSRRHESAAELRKKFLGDCASAVAAGAEAVAFVTNQDVKPSERRDLVRAASVTVELYHLERLVAILDAPAMHAIRKQFLDIEPGAPALDRATLIDQAMRSSEAWCAAHWQAVGIPRRAALELAADHDVGARGPDLLPTEEEPVVVWTAEMGSGKSLGAARAHQAALELARAGADAPIPVFLEAAEVLPSLRDAVTTSATELGDPRSVGAHVVVDGVDELGQQAAAELLKQSRTLSAAWPATTVLLTSRPVPVLVEAPERRELAPLVEEAVDACVQIGLGEESGPPRLYGLPESVKQTLGRPLFALLTGVWMREHQGAPAGPVDLLAELGRRATRELAVDEAHLRSLAALAVARELGPVPTAEVVPERAVADLLATGMIMQRGHGLAFTLPALAQWFAAQAILADEVSVQALLGAPEDLELWRYPLGLAVAVGASQQAEAILDTLLHGAAGFAFRVVEIALGQAPEGETAVLPPWREAGQMVRGALQSLVSALDPLAQCLPDVDEEGRVRPMAVSGGKTHLTVAFYRGPEPRPEIFAFPDDFRLFDAGPDWGGLRASEIVADPRWALRWARDAVLQRLDALLEQRAIPIPGTGPLAEEEAWAAALDLAGENMLSADALPLDPLLATLGAMLPDGPSGGRVGFVRPARRAHEANGVFAYLAALRDAGASEIRAPLPGRDTSGGGWIGDFYTRERLHEIARCMYGSAIEAYVELIDRWLPGVAEHLEHRVLLPGRLVAYVDPGSHEGFGPIPTATGFIEPLPEGSRSQVDVRAGRLDFISDGDGIWNRQQARRPAAARWLPGTVGSLPFEVGEPYAVSDVVYGWLTTDLRSLGLASRSAPRSGRDGMTVWDGVAARPRRAATPAQ